MTDFPQGDQLSTLSELARRLYDAEAQVLRLQAELKRAVRVRDAIQFNEIPEYLNEVGIREFATDDVKVSVEDQLLVQPRAENRPLVLLELEKLGAGTLIKSTVTVAFDRGQEETAKTLMSDLVRNGLQPKQEKWVEPSTLKKFVRTRLENGQVVDADLFGVRQLRKANFVSGAPEVPVFDGE